jgi:hypothetical protein
MSSEERRREEEFREESHGWPSDRVTDLLGRDNGWIY